MKLESDGINFEQVFKKIKLTIAVALIGGGSYLGVETFLIVKSVLIEPMSLKKWVELRPAIMAEPQIEAQTSPQKLPLKTVSSETDPLILWVLLGYFSIVLGILYSYILVKISLGLLTSGIILLTKNFKNNPIEKI